MSLGGQTVILGNVISVIGCVSIVVFTGLSAQAWKDAKIKHAAPVNPAMTARIQRVLTWLLVVAMYLSPWMVEDSKNVLTFSMVEALMKQFLVKDGDLWVLNH